MDKNLLLFYIGSSLMWFLFMVITVVDGADRLINSQPKEMEATCKVDLTCNNGCPKTVCACTEDPGCNEAEIKFEVSHPFGEFLPNLLLTTLLGLGVWFGYQLYSNGAASSEPRAIKL